MYNVNPEQMRKPLLPRKHKSVNNIFSIQKNAKRRNHNPAKCSKDTKCEQFQPLERGHRNPMALTGGPFFEPEEQPLVTGE